MSSHSKPQPFPPTLSIIIPVYRGGSAFHECLAAVASLRQKPFEVIIVLDGNLQEDLEVARSYDFQVLALSCRQGPAVARNFGAIHATGEYLLFLDADVVIPSDFSARVSNFFESGSEISAAFGSYDDRPTERNLVSQWKNLFHHLTHQQSREEASTFWAGCGCIRRHAFLHVGGFNERFTEPSVEDIELGYRLKEHGYRIRLIKSWQVTHLKHWTLLKLVKTDVCKRALPWSLLILQGSERFQNDLNLSISGRMSGLALLAMIPTLGLTLFQSPTWGALLFFLLGSLMIVNASVYSFFLRKRGIRFLLGAIALHWFYYGYSALTFVSVAGFHTLFSDWAFFRVKARSPLVSIDNAFPVSG